jgi:hypothetical protein
MQVVTVALIRRGNKACVYLQGPNGTWYRAIVEGIDGEFSHFRNLPAYLGIDGYGREVATLREVPDLAEDPVD